MLKRVLTVALALSVILSGCASTRAADASTTQFSGDVGTASHTDATDVAHRILALNRFEILEEHDHPMLHIETRWLPRQPFPDEANLGIDAAQARVVVRGRPRNTTSALGAAYAVDVLVEQRVRRAGESDWIQMAITRSAREYASGIVDHIRRELKTGVRKF